MPRGVNSSQIVSVPDLRPLARRRLPKVVFDYLDGGADGEVTLRENCRAFEDVTFRPRGAVSVPTCDLRTRVLNFDLAIPVLLAPVGYSRLMYPEGEIAAARCAGQAGTAYILSTISGHRLEDVKAASAGPVWFQLYLMGGRAAAEGSIARAEASRVLRLGRYHRHRGRGHARARLAQRHEGTDGRRNSQQDSLPGPVSLPSRMAHSFSARRRRPASSQRCTPRPGPHADDRCRRCARQFNGDME